MHEDKLLNIFTFRWKKSSDYDGKMGQYSII